MAVYEVHTALASDHNESLVWIRCDADPALRDQIDNRRPIVCITHRSMDGKTHHVYCVAAYADNRYLKQWAGKAVFQTNNAPNLIFISGWYRRRLDVHELQSVELEVTVDRSISTFLYRFPRQHPQPLVLQSTMLGLLSFGLGIIGIGLGVLSLAGGTTTSLIGWIMIVIGFVITVLGALGLIPLWR